MVVEPIQNRTSEAVGFKSLLGTGEADWGGIIAFLFTIGFLVILLLVAVGIAELASPLTEFMTLIFGYIAGRYTEAD
ncbi:signaling protein [Halobiforma nitratireducens]|uniref:signaling protein n=1 Tax=Halobiforma nitratireducens TaxID=130048 RepID=UPI001EF9CB27|nr:signaling protein [Halobiforma nitratireducens]